MTLKRIILSTVLCFTIIAVNAQDQDQNPKNFNEVKLNALSLVIGAIDVGYERTLNEESSIGISAFIPFDENLKDDIQYFISPYYLFWIER